MAKKHHPIILNDWRGRSGKLAPFSEEEVEAFVQAATALLALAQHNTFAAADVIAGYPEGAHGKRSWNLAKAVAGKDFGRMYNSRKKKTV